MKTLRNIFFIVAACLVTSLAATAQSNDQLAQQLVEEMVKALNSQEIKSTLCKNADLSNFNASADGKTIVLSMRMIKSYNLSVLSESQKNELANSLSQVLVEGITEEDSDGTVINAFRLLKIKIKVILKDQYGNSLTKTVDF